MPTGRHWQPWTTQPRCLGGRTAAVGDRPGTQGQFEALEPVAWWRRLTEPAVGASRLTGSHCHWQCSCRLLSCHEQSHARAARAEFTVKAAHSLQLVTSHDSIDSAQGSLSCVPPFPVFTLHIYKSSVANAHAYPGLRDPKEVSHFSKEGTSAECSMESLSRSRILCIWGTVLDVTRYDFTRGEVAHYNRTSPYCTRCADGPSARARYAGAPEPISLTRSHIVALALRCARTPSPGQRGSKKEL